MAITLATWALLVTAMNADKPVTFAFVRDCGPADGRTDPYDLRTQQYHLKVRGVARFRVAAVSDDLLAQPVVLRITGMLDRPESPLTLEVDGKQYPLHHDKFDDKLFKVQRNAGVTTIEFLPAGKALLKPGATFRYIDYYRG